MQDAIIDRPDWIEYRNSLKVANPDFELVHYSDDEARAFIKEHYGDTILEQAYDMVTPIMRADLFRLAAIYKLGGFYMVCVHSTAYIMLSLHALLFLSCFSIY